MSTTRTSIQLAGLFWPWHYPARAAIPTASVSLHGQSPCGVWRGSPPIDRRVCGEAKVPFLSEHGELKKEGRGGVQPAWKFGDYSKYAFKLYIQPAYLEIFGWINWSMEEAVRTTAQRKLHRTQRYLAASIPPRPRLKGTREETKNISKAYCGGEMMIFSEVVRFCIQDPHME